MRFELQTNSLIYTLFKRESESIVFAHSECKEKENCEINYDERKRSEDLFHFS